MNDLQLNKILYIIIIMLSCIIIYYYFSQNKYENFVNTIQSNQAIQNVGNSISNINTTVTLNRLQVTGTVNCLQLKGIIVAWSGSIDNIPSGWGLCDGTNYTALDNTQLQSPDLRSRFIIGTGSIYTTNLKGGEETHILTVDEIPAHIHTYSEISESNYNTGQIFTPSNSANFTQTQSGSTGGDASGNTIPHNNMPPYYTLAYIMKL